MTDKRTRRRFDRRTRTLKKRTWKNRPFLTTDLGRKVGANYVPLLADYIAGKRAEQPPPRRGAWNTSSPRWGQTSWLCRPWGR